MGEEEDAKNIKCQAVSGLLSYSSEYGFANRRCYSIDNCIGEAHEMRYGDFTDSVVFRTYGTYWTELPYHDCFPPIGHTPDWFRSTDFIEVEFEKPVYPVSLDIYETLCPGALVRVLASDFQTVVPSRHLSRWKTLWSSREKAGPHRFNICKIKFPKLNKKSFPTKRLRLEFNSSLAEYYYEFNAVHLHGYKKLPARKQKEAKANEKKMLKDRVLSTVTVSVPVKELENLKITDNRPAVEVDPALDFISRLPPELLHTILSYLLDPRDRCEARRVSHLFKESLDCETEMNFRPFFTRLTGGDLVRFVRRNEMITRLDLSWTGVDGIVTSGDVLSALAELPHLTELACENCEGFVDDAFLEGVNKFTQLRALNIRHCGTVDIFLLQDLANLELLDISECMVHLSKPTERPEIYVSFFKNFPKLQWFLASSNSTEMFPLDCVLRDNLFEDMLAHCQGLRGINVWRHRDHSFVHLFNPFLAKFGPTLEYLDIGWTNIRPATWKNLAQSCPRLQVLVLTHLQCGVSDEDLEALARNCPDLEQLDLLAMQEFTLAGVRNLLERCSKMKFLDLSYCSRLDRQEVAELQEKYPVVKFVRLLIDQDGIP